MLSQKKIVYFESDSQSKSYTFLPKMDGHRQEHSWDVLIKMEGAAQSCYDSNLTLLPFNLKAYWKYILTQIIWQM